MYGLKFIVGLGFLGLCAFALLSMLFQIRYEILGAIGLMVVILICAKLADKFLR